MEAKAKAVVALLHQESARNVSKLIRFTNDLAYNRGDPGGQRPDR
jgi:hypothetical protein